MDLPARGRELLAVYRDRDLEPGSDHVRFLCRGPRGAGDPYDGITELWWGDEAALRETLGTDDARAAALDLLEDERRFIDLEASSIFLTEEHEIFGG